MNFRDEIPKMAFLNAQIVQLAERSKQPFQDCVRTVCDSYGIESYGLTNPAHAIGLLYCLVVVPREAWWTESLLKRVEAHKAAIQLFRVKIPQPKETEGAVGDLIRHLRNAVAHADFSVAADGTWTFRDRWRRNDPPVFEAEISSDGLAAFLSTVGAEMANASDDA